MLLVDVGIHEPASEPDIGCDKVAWAGGADIGELAAAGERGVAVVTMARGAEVLLPRLDQADQGRHRRSTVARRHDMRRSVTRCVLHRYVVMVLGPVVPDEHLTHRRH